MHPRCSHWDMNQIKLRCKGSIKLRRKYVLHACRCRTNYNCPPLPSEAEGLVVHTGQSPVVCQERRLTYMTTWYGPGRTGLKVLHLMDCASHPSNMHLVKALQHPTQMEGFMWSSYMYMALQMCVIHVGDWCNSYTVCIYLVIYWLCMCVCGRFKKGWY